MKKENFIFSDDKTEVVEESTSAVIKERVIEEMKTKGVEKGSGAERAEKGSGTEKEEEAKEEYQGAEEEYQGADDYQGRDEEYGEYFSDNDPFEKEKDELRKKYKEIGRASCR